MPVRGANKTDQSVSFSWSGPSNDQEDGKDKAADRPQAAPELWKQPGVV